MKTLAIKLFAWMLLTTATVYAQPPIPAFPGAEGSGSTTTHGRGGKLIEVTNLNDSGPGSLRAACQTTGARIIVFRVGGIINLASRIEMNQPYCYIAGQTAPGDGICLRGAPLQIQTHDVVVRGLRSRPGDAAAGFTFEDRDAFQMDPRKNVFKDQTPTIWNVVMDHCSGTWSTDEVMGFYGDDITIQWSLFAEPLHNSQHPKGPHGYGVLVGDYSDRISLHHNLIAHNLQRSPLLKAGTSTDIVNNVIYNWGNSCIGLSNYEETNQPIYANIVNNYFKKGPSTTLDYNVYINSNVPTASDLYLKGNISNLRPADTGNEWAIANTETGYRTNTRINAPAVTTYPAMAAYDVVLNNAGATSPRRDAVDSRIVTDVRNGTGRIIDSPSQVGGYPSYATATAPADTDRDGMPDTWETAQGLNPNVADGNQDRNNDGYTNVEEYVNSLITMPGTATGSSLADGIYKLTSKVSVGGTPLRCLDVSSSQDVDGRNVQIWETNPTAAQRWSIQSTGDGYYRLTSQVGTRSRVLQATNGGKGNGANVVISQPTLPSTGPDQRWKIEDMGDGYYKLTTKASANEATKYCLDVWGGYNVNGGSDPSEPNKGNVIIWQDSGGDNQRWKIESTSAARIASEVKPGSETSLISISPNPASESVTLTLQAQRAQTVVVDILNGQGVSTGRVKKTIQAGQQQVSIRVRQYKKGLYLVNVTLDGQRHVKKLIVE